MNEKPTHFKLAQIQRLGQLLQEAKGTGETEALLAFLRGLQVELAAIGPAYIAREGSGEAQERVDRASLYLGQAIHHLTEMTWMPTASDWAMQDYFLSHLIACIGPMMGEVS